MKHLKIFIFSAVALISAVVIRTIQLFFLTDPVTGFYKQGLEEIGTMLMVVLIGVVAISSLFIFIFNKEKINTTPSSSPVLGCVAIFAGVANLIEPFFNNVFLNSVPNTLVGLRFLMILASGAVFCWFGISILFGVKLKAGLSILIIIAWVIRLMSSFICFTGMSNISENLYDVLMLIFTLIFFLYFGKAICGISKSQTNRRLLVSGLAAISFTAASSVPCLIAYLLNITNFVHVPIDSPVTGVFVALFISMYLVDICKNSHSVE